MATDWRITTQAQTTTLTQDGRFIDSMEVNFITLPEETPGRITVPLNQYTAEFVRQEIDSRVAEMKAVQEL